MMDGSTPASVIARIRATGSSPSACARSADITSMAEAPSEICDEVPAVTVPPCGLNAGGRLARPSRVVSGRMVSSCSTSASAPAASWPSTGMISRANLPSTVALWASWCERRPSLSCASRPMPCIMARYSAVMPIMPAALATFSPSLGLISTSSIIGRWPRCSTPPTRYTSPMPAMMLAAAVCRADMEEPQRRLTVCAGMVNGSCARRTMLRARFMPCSPRCSTQPQITSSISATSSFGLRASRPRITATDRSSARTLRKQPFLERPMALRAKSTITASLGFRLTIILLFSPGAQ